MTLFLMNDFFVKLFSTLKSERGDVILNATEKLTGNLIENTVVSLCNNTEIKFINEK